VKFNKILKHVVWRLIVEDSVSYHSIRRDFGLDDEALEDLRRFLVQKKALATDRDGRFLVWTGAAESVAAMSRPTALPPLAIETVAPPRAEAIISPKRTQPAPLATAEPAAAQRRHLTVMFCDLVGSTDLASRLDPEDMADVIRAYQDVASAIIQQYDGYIAKFMGDGILVYFGFPHALEKDAARAVRTALSIVEALPALNADIGRAKDVKLAVRIGIATGLVMVGESIGSGGGAEKTVVGETPNLAARLQGLAGPDGIVISAVTRELAGDDFTYGDLGMHELKGLPEPVGAWEVKGAIDTAAKIESEKDDPANAPMLVGRDEEIGLLRRAWQHSRDENRGQVVMVSGEPGIGKSTLMASLRAELEKQRLTRLTMRCSPYHVNSALYPVIEHFKRAAGWQREDGDEAKLIKLEQLLSRYSMPTEDTVPLMATLMSLAIAEDRYPALRLTPQQLKQQTSDMLVALTLEAAEQSPVLNLYEDLHWADSSTLELIGQLIDQVPTVPLLMVLTYRPEFVPPWPNRSHVTPITLNRLERPQIEALARGLAGGKELPQEVLDYIVRKTDGVPLYVEELTKTILGSGILREESGLYALTAPLSGLAIPASLQEVLMARLDRLPTVRDVAQLGAVFGREFSYEMLRGIAVFQEAKLKDGLGQLVNAELLYQRGRAPRATYTFKHALIQDSAYQSLLKRTRQEYHQQAAALLEKNFPEVVEAQPELLAHHYAESGRTEPAIAYLEKAGQQAARRSANREVIAHATRALELLASLPEGPDRAGRELALQRLLGNALMANKGFGAPETGAAFQRARELCEVVGTSNVICPVLAGAWLFEQTRANHRVGKEVAEDIIARATTSGDIEALVVGHVAACASDFYQGAPALSLQHGQQAIELYETHRPDRLGFHYGLSFHLAGYLHAGWCEWLLGRPDSALQLGIRGLAELDQEKHLFSVSRILYHSAMLHQLRGEASIVLERATRSRETANEHGFPLVVAASQVMQGVAQAALGDAELGISEIRQGLDAYRATGARYQVPYYMMLLANALHASGNVGDAASALAESIELGETLGERFCEAEMHRLRATLLLARDRANRPEAIRCLQAALAVAKTQQARSYELLAARDLAALWADDGQRREAHELLAPVLAGFTEGHDAPAQVSSRQLVNSLH
jgi:class 3 adenylate cyclase/predicted ATPase